MNSFQGESSEKRWRSQLLSKIKSDINGLADELAERIYEENFSPMVTLKECIQYFTETSKKLSGKIEVGGFILSVKENAEPKNENDAFIIIQGLIDRQQKPIIYNGETISRVLHAKTIDAALIRALDGKDSGIFTV